MSPRKTLFLFGAMLLCNVVAFGQASGSFNYNLANATTACTVNHTSGTITGGVSCGPLISGGNSCTTSTDCSGGAACSGQVACTATTICPGQTLAGVGCDAVSGFCTNSGICNLAPGTVASTSCIGNTDVTMKTSSGNGNVFVVRPAAVVALLTDVTLNSKQQNTSGVVSSAAYAGVDFQVSLLNQPKGAKSQVIPNYAVTYDARFIQISTNLFQAIAAQCQAITGGCFIQFNESTASAHSFDWIVAPLSAGNYDVGVTWTESLANQGIAETETCVGPVNLTVQQNKIFAPSEGSATTVSF
jgi:hypothetical protein